MSNENEGVAFIRSLLGAWDCCGTCAGGVLLKRERQRMALAFDEGWNASADYMSASYDGPDDVPNPYEDDA